VIIRPKDADHRHAASSDLERLAPSVDPASLPGGAGTLRDRY